VLFAASTYDPYGPHGAKPMSEAPFNPVAPALANAVRDATGVRFTALPLRRDVVYGTLRAARRPDGPAGEGNAGDGQSHPSLVIIGQLI
jgi:hypothetical protein